MAGLDEQQVQEIEARIALTESRIIKFAVGSAISVLMGIVPMFLWGLSLINENTASISDVKSWTTSHDKWETSQELRISEVKTDVREGLREVKNSIDDLRTLIINSLPRETHPNL